MFKKAFDNTPKTNGLIRNILKFFSSSYYIYYHLFADQYILQIDSFYYCTKQHDYILNLRFRNKGYILTSKIKDIFLDKVIFHFISPIDSYIIGLLYGMSLHKIIHNDSDTFLEYFRKYNTPQVSKPMILITRRDYLGNQEEISLKPKYQKTIIKTNWKELAKRPFLIQGLSATDAVTVGISSVNCFVNELCQAS